MRRLPCLIGLTVHLTLLSVCWLSSTSLTSTAFLHPATKSATPKRTVRHASRIFLTSSNKPSFSSFFEEHCDGVDPALIDVLRAVAQSCIQISRRLATLPLSNNDSEEVTTTEDTDPYVKDDGISVNVQGEVQKEMDVVANMVFKKNLKPYVAAMASEEEEEIVFGDGKHYEIAFDPLDGSSNLDISIPTGSIFGIYPHSANGRPFSKSGRNLVAAGYALYSSSTELVIAIAGGATGSSPIGFTLDPTCDANDPLENSFRISRQRIRCPLSGPYYSLNEAREPDWPDGLKQWIHDAKRGLTSTKQKYSSRYVCSLCGDFHRTLLKGGWAGNPRPHLRLLYEAAPLAFVAEAAGGMGSDGVRNLLDIEPTGLHDRVCVFLGSTADITDLVSYGEIQQGAKRYKS